MSYAIAPTFEGNTIGVRHLGALRGAGVMLSGLGDALADQYAAELIQGGVDPALVSMLQLNGATSTQLAAVYDGSLDPVSLLNQLTGAQGPSNPAASPQNPIMQPQPILQTAAGYVGAAASAVINTAFGAFDLTQKSAWNGMAAIMQQAQQQINEVARMLPNDPDVIQHVASWNDVVRQFAGYWQKAFGSRPSNLPFASIPTLSGLGQEPVTDTTIGIGAAALYAAGVAALLGIVYGYIQWAQSKKASAQAQLQSTQNQNQMIGAFNAAVASGNTALAQQILGQLKSLGITQPGTPTSFTTWLEQHMTWILVGVGVVMIVPPLLERRHEA